MALEKRRKTTIGWSEYIEFPDWKVKGLRAKVDTGARSSALHVETLKQLPGNRVRFKVRLSRKNPGRTVSVTAPIERWGRVRSSTGVYSLRCFVRTRIRIGPVEKEIEISLVSREKMLFRMLLGRKALERDFIVDVSKRSVLGKPAPKAKKKSPAP